MNETIDPDLIAGVNRALEALRAGRAEIVERHCAALVGTAAEPDARHLMAMLRLGQNRAADALAEIDAALRLAPREAALYMARATALRTLGRGDEAMSTLKIAINLAPDFATAHYNLGNLLRERGRYKEALAAYGRAVAAAPGDVNMMANQAGCLAAVGEVTEAEAACRKLVEAAPDNALAWTNLGHVLYQRRRDVDALEAFDAALERTPHLADAHNGRGIALARMGRDDEAEDAYRRAIALDPTNPGPRMNLGGLLARQGRLEESIAVNTEAAKLAPDTAVIHNNLGLALSALGRSDAAVAAFDRALALDPGNLTTASNRLMAMNYSETMAPEAVAEAHRAWAARFAPAPTRPEPADPRPDRRLRVGYLSPDFRSHSVAFFIKPVLAAHDRGAVEAVCYCDVDRPDAMTEAIEARADRWRDVARLSDAELRQAIQDDGIDVLVDLAGHTAGNRLAVFAARPAPVQVSWIGYPNTTGLAAMDARLTDAIADPPGGEGLYSEKLVRLPRGFLAYDPPVEAGPVAPLPATETGVVTFGSFNNLAKTSVATIDAWAAVLTAVPGARLLLKSRPLVDPLTRDRVTGLFAERGIGAERLELLGQVPDPLDHLRLYRRVDIALDPFPYNGTTTTCEAMWMGVPVVALAGAVHAARVGASLLRRAGLDDLVGATVEDYVAIAARLAGDLDALAGLRAGLRGRMAPLCDATAVARDVEAAYRTLWREALEARG